MKHGDKVDLHAAETKYELKIKVCPSYISLPHGFETLLTYKSQSPFLITADVVVNREQTMWDLQPFSFLYGFTA